MRFTSACNVPIAYIKQKVAGRPTVPVARVSEQLKRVQELVIEGQKQGQNLDRKYVVKILGNGVDAAESQPLALFCFLHSCCTLQQGVDFAITYAISMGGDTDSIASMTGALAGAYLGASKVPRWLTAKCEGMGEMVRLADKLHAHVIDRQISVTPHKGAVVGGRL
eukprot:GDKI01020091.1.p1 GENE.GDKI01020091.1~~GDKI01020091.1.p1  ORF type:complete len:166 (+),score=42.26 GDKI01020091.1:105-602(+)